MVNLSSRSETVFAIVDVFSMLGDSCSDNPLSIVPRHASASCKITWLWIGQKTALGCRYQTPHDISEPTSDVSQMTSGKGEILAPSFDGERVTPTLLVDSWAEVYCEGSAREVLI